MTLGPLGNPNLGMMRWMQALAALSMGAQAAGSALGGQSPALGQLGQLGQLSQGTQGPARASLDPRGAQALGAWSGGDSFTRGGAGFERTGGLASSRDTSGVGARSESTGPSYQARGTGYYPANNRMEGGFKDRKGAPLHTLQDYLAGKAPFVSVAMDSKAFPYGTKLRIPELEQKYGRPIDFRVVDTGGAFRGKGTSRIDICTANRAASLDPTINGRLTLVPQR